MDEECQFQYNIHKLCCEDLLGIPVETFPSVYERVYKKPISQIDIHGYNDVADFIRVRMSNSLAEVEYKGRRLFVPKSRAIEYIKKRPEDYKLVNQEMPTNSVMSTLPKSRSLRRPHVNMASQTSHGELTPSEFGFESHSVSSQCQSSPSSPIALPVVPINQQKKLDGSFSDNSDDETRSIMEDDSNAVFSPCLRLFKPPLRSKHVAKNAGLENLSSRDQDIFSGWRAPSKCGSVMDFTDSDDSDCTVNDEIESPDSGHYSPDNVQQLSDSGPIVDQRNYDGVLKLLQKLPEYRMSRRKQLSAEIGKLQETVIKLQTELRNVQCQAGADLLLKSRVERYLRSVRQENYEMTKLESILYKDENVFMESIVKANAKLVQDILNGKEVDLSQVKLPEDYSAALL